MRRVLGVLGVPTLLLLTLLHSAGAKNTSSITDPLQRVMLRFNLYQVGEGMKNISVYSRKYLLCCRTR